MERSGSGDSIIPELITDGLLRDYLMRQREALLMQVDAIERLLEMPRTAELRKAQKDKLKNVVQSTKQ
jgi:hypothetical protein